MKKLKSVAAIIDMSARIGAHHSLHVTANQYYSYRVLVETMRLTLDTHIIGPESLRYGFHPRDRSDLLNFKDIEI